MPSWIRIDWSMKMRETSRAVDKKLQVNNNEKSPIGVGLCVEAYKQGLITGKCLIVVKASLKYQWSKEIEKFSDLKASIIDTPSKAGKKKFEEQFKNCDIFIANYETLKNEKVAERLHNENIELIYAD